MWILSTIPLEGPEIISVTEFGPDFLKDFKIVLLSLGPDCLLEVPPEVSGYTIVIEQRKCLVISMTRPVSRPLFMHSEV